MKESVIYQEIFETGLQRGLQQGIERGIEQGIQRGLQKVAGSLLRENMTLEQVAKLTGLTIEQLQNLQDSLDNN
jgi:predicted transposase/invertase (TIGR01784 family)